MKINNLNHYMIYNAIVEAKRRETLAFREKAIIKDFAYAEIEQQTGFKTAYLFDTDGNGFQMVVAVKESHHKLGDITN